MAKHSPIEWTQSTWNPWHGCHKVSAGCKNCYMFREKKQYGQDPNVVVRSKTKFYDPLKWPEPRTIFTCSWSDFFIEEADPWRDEAFAIMALTPQHTYQVLTKRPDRMQEWFKGRGSWPIITMLETLKDSWPAAWYEEVPHLHEIEWPLKNVWLGVSVEDQKTADERIPLLLQTPAARRWLSVEPLLGPINLDLNKIDWIVAGGESGPDARPMHPSWIRSIRNQCIVISAEVPFFFKQWGEWMPLASADEASHFPHAKMHEFDSGERMVLTGKKRAGRILDGRTWDEMPEVSRA